MGGRCSLTHSARRFPTVYCLLTTVYSSYSSHFAGVFFSSEGGAGSQILTVES